MTQSFSERINIILPESKEISYQDLLPASTTSSQSSSIQKSYHLFKGDLITRVETFGISSKAYKSHIENPNDDSCSFLSSFIESDSEESSFSSQIFNQAIEEGFLVVECCDIKPYIKRRRNSSDFSEELLNMIKEIQEYFSMRGSRYITIKALKMLRGVEQYMKDYSEDEKEIVFNKIGYLTKLNVKNIKQQLVIDMYKREKKVAHSEFLACFREFKDCQDKENSKYMDQIDAKLRIFVELHNKLESFNKKNKDFLTFEAAKDKYFYKSPLLTQRKSVECFISGFQTEDSETDSNNLVHSEQDPSKILQ